MKEDVKQQLDYLEDERKKLWNKIIALEESLKKKTSDFESDAKQSSENALLAKTTSENAKNEILENLNTVIAKADEVKGIAATVQELKVQVDAIFVDTKEKNDNVNTIYTSIEPRTKLIQENSVKIEDIFSQIPAFESNIQKLEEILTKGSDYDSKLSVLFKSGGDSKKEIDKLYYEILGYTDKDESTGVETRVRGLKDKLEDSYSNIESKIEQSTKEIEEIKIKSTQDFEKFYEEKENQVKETSEKWNLEYTNTFKRINDLLPNALTGGLSFAYADKRSAEENESKKFLIAFYSAIGGLILISLIPLFISLRSMSDGTSLETVILRIPRLVLAILPLYVPVLWVAYSSNRKMNLSKRLIEEYSHKEVLSKTFEGLSNQINNVNDKNITSDLRTRLLYNILEVNSENPGKLISDYNKSDHPLMDALDKSVKLSNAVTKFSKVPGLSKLMTMLEQRAEGNLEKQVVKAEEGLDIISKEGTNNKKKQTVDS